jgi:hypothetical protein
MEGIPNSDKKLVKTGEGPGGYPEYVFKRVNLEHDDEMSADDTLEMTESLEETDVGELSESELLKIQEAARQAEEHLPGELNEEQQKNLRGILQTLAQSNAAKYVRSGLAALVIGGGVGTERGESVASLDTTTYENELNLDNQYATDLVSEEFQEELRDRLRNPEQYLTEFDRRVAEVETGITDSDVARTMEYARKPVVGAEDFTRADYVAEEIKFREWNPETGEGVPPELEEELRKFLPALCFVESRFDADRESSVNAKGIFQIMPEIWEKYGGEPGAEKSLKAQVEVAGQILSDMYQQLQNRMGEAVMSELREQFPSEQAFQKDFMLLALLNSYNAGDGTVAEAIMRYLADTDPADRPRGRDLYAAVSDYAHLKDDGYLKYFKNHSKNYPYQIMAAANRINQNRG